MHTACLPWRMAPECAVGRRATRAETSISLSVARKDRELIEHNHGRVATPEWLVENEKDGKILILVPEGEFLGAVADKT